VTIRSIPGKFSLTENSDFGTSFSWIQSVAFPTCVYACIRRIHPVDNEVKNAFLWLADLESPPAMLIVDAVSPVNDVNITVVVR